MKLCEECGYTQKVDDCPMCVPCSDCGRKLMQCVCIEGE
jgi:hypothetical protein